MEVSWITQLGPYAVIVAFAVYVILKDMGFLYGNRKNNNGTSARENASLAKIRNIEVLCYDIKKKTDDLYKWHDVLDSDGVRIWYVRKSLEEAIIKLADNIETQTEVMRTIIETQKQTNTDLKILSDKVA